GCSPRTTMPETCQSPLALTVVNFPPTVAGAAAELSKTVLPERQVLLKQTHRIPLVSSCEHHRSRTWHWIVTASTINGRGDIETAAARRTGCRNQRNASAHRIAS